ncbi:raffinose synthase, partial [Toxoplasma gondii RUB]
LRADASTAQLEHWKREMSVIPHSLSPAFYDLFYSHLGKLGIYGTKVDAQAMAALVSEGSLDSTAVSYLRGYLLAVQQANARFLVRDFGDEPTAKLPHPNEETAERQGSFSSVCQEPRLKGGIEELGRFALERGDDSREILPDAEASEGDADAVTEDRSGGQVQATDNMLNCMGLTVPNVYLSGSMLIMRSSEDHAFHGVVETAQNVAQHIWHNAANSLWLSPFFVTDWDMFRVCAWHSRIHAVARIISGGPIYISDSAEYLKGSLNDGGVKSWRKLLQQLRLPGCPLPIIGRCTGTPCPTMDSIFLNPLTTPRGYKVVNNCPAGVLVAIFGLHDSGATPYSAIITVSDVAGHLPVVLERANLTGSAWMPSPLLSDPSVESVEKSERFPMALLCTDLDETAWECHDSPIGDHKINAAPLDRKSGWTVSPLYYMSTRLFAVTPIFSTGCLLEPSVSKSSVTLGTPLFETLHVSLIGGRSLVSVYGETTGCAKGEAAASDPRTQGSSGPTTIVSPLAPPLVFKLVMHRRGTWEAGEANEIGVTSKGQTVPHCGHQRLSCDYANVKMDNSQTPWSRESEANRHVRVTECYTILQGIYFEVHKAAMLETCSILLWSDGPRLPECCKIPAGAGGVWNEFAAHDRIHVRPEEAIHPKAIQSCTFGGTIYEIPLNEAKHREGQLMSPDRTHAYFVW